MADSSWLMADGRAEQLKTGCWLQVCALFRLLTPDHWSLVL